MILIRDVHSFKEAEQSIRFFAYHDPLTKLANRRAFYEQADQALLQADTLALVVIADGDECSLENRDAHGDVDGPGDDGEAHVASLHNLGKDGHRLIVSRTARELARRAGG